MPDVLTMPEVAPDAPVRPPIPPERRPLFSRRWRRFGGGVLLVASVSTLLWWHHGVTTDPGLDFNGVNVFRSFPGDVSGITRVDNTMGTEVRIEFGPGGTLDFRLADCDPARLQAGGYSVVESLPVTYTVLGFRRTVDVPFDMTALSVHAMGECNHPLPPRR